MLTSAPPHQHTRSITAAALISGVAGVAANALLVAFFVLAFGLGRSEYSWLGTVNDAMIMVQFLALICVASALPAWLPPTRSLGVATVIGAVAMVLVTVLQLLLIVGVLPFETQVLLVVAAFLPVYGWVLTVSSVGHRSGALPRPVTRFGLILGVSFPIGLMIFAAGLPLGWGSPGQLAFAITGGVLGGLSWLALPVWPLLLARFVFARARRTPVHEWGKSS